MSGDDVNIEWPLVVQVLVPYFVNLVVDVLGCAMFGSFVLHCNVADQDDMMLSFALGTHHGIGII